MPRMLSFALALTLALFAPQSMDAAPTSEQEMDAAHASVWLDSVRARWPIAREAGGQWGVVGEVIASHSRSTALTIQALHVTLWDDAGRVLAHRRYDDPLSLAGLLRIATVETDPARWRPAGTTMFASDEHAVAFVAEIVESRPSWATIGYEFDEQRPASITVPLDVYQPPQRLTWPTLVGGQPWLATATAGTPPHSQGGAILQRGRLFVSQRFALDLRQIDDELQTHPAGAVAKEEYYTWGQPVISMGRGRIVAVVQGDPDYDIGAPIPPTQHPAGNYIVVQHGRAAFGVYAHLQQGSARVREGQWVERGQTLALVGNSGNTSEPHLHVHVADRWSGESDPLAAFFLAEGVPALFWRAQVYREGTWLPLRGTTPTEFDIIVPNDQR